MWIDAEIKILLRGIKVHKAIISDSERLVDLVEKHLNLNRFHFSVKLYSNSNNNVWVDTVSI